MNKYFNNSVIARRFFLTKPRQGGASQKTLAMTLFVSISLIPFAFSQQELQVQEPQVQKLTLMDCYKMALVQSEKLAKSRALIDETEGRIRQAFSQILPHASFVYTNDWEDKAGQKNFARHDAPEAKFTVSQPLFRGFKEFAALSASRAERKSLNNDFIRAKELLFQDVMEAFYSGVSYKKDLEALESIRFILEGRLEEVKKREKLGRSRESDGTSTELRLNRLIAEEELVKVKRQSRRI